MTRRAPEILANAIEDDAKAYELGNLGDIGSQIESVINQVRPINNIPRPIYKLTLQFWKEWALFSRDTSRHKASISDSDWPIMARTIAHHVRVGTMPNDKMIIDHFVRKPPIKIWPKLKSLINRSA